ncbi:MAG: SDR family oxidoreductase [Magnetococcales bacterium]|nr:SDR family oxidoreductase [Magnetococcales bacterium]
MQKDGQQGSSGMQNVWNGFKVAIALMLGWPFIAILLPMWLVYSWYERRQGRSVSHAPWSILMQALRRSRRQRAEADAQTLRYGRIRLEEEQVQDDDSSSHRKPLVTCPAPDCVADTVRLGRIALVTGGGKRIGAAIGRELAGMGYAVGVVYAHDLDSARNTVETIVRHGGTAAPLCWDASDPDSAERMLDEVSTTLDGVPDLLINNAAKFLPTRINPASWEELDTLMRTNLNGPIWLMLRTAQRMLDRSGGQIINIADLWGERPLGGHAAYCASKAGLIMATQVLAKDLAPHVRVNAIAPGAILPPDADDPSAHEAYQRLLSRTPLADSASSDAVLHAIRYLLSAHYVTGEVLRVDGGRWLQ